MFFLNVITYLKDHVPSITLSKSFVNFILDEIKDTIEEIVKLCSDWLNIVECSD